MKIFDCCGAAAGPYEDYGIYPDCKEHCEWEEDTEETEPVMLSRQKTFTHPTFARIEKAAKAKGEKINETDVSFYFRIFENKQCVEMHIFYKPKK